MNSLINWCDTSSSTFCRQIRPGVARGREYGQDDFERDLLGIAYRVGRAQSVLVAAGLVPEPGENWMKQVARNLTNASDGFLRGIRYLIHDRSRLFTEQFQGILSSAGVGPLRLPARSPKLNAFAERFFRRIKEPCLDKLVLLGESSLRQATSQFVLHYHTGRNHQGLENKVIRPEVGDFPPHGCIHCRKRLGGMLRYYYREAA